MLTGTNIYYFKEAAHIVSLVDVKYFVEKRAKLSPKQKNVKKIVYCSSGLFPW